MKVRVEYKSNGRWLSHKDFEETELTTAYPEAVASLARLDYMPQRGTLRVTELPDDPKPRKIRLERKIANDWHVFGVYDLNKPGDVKALCCACQELGADNYRYYHTLRTVEVE